MGYEGFDKWRKGKNSIQDISMYSIYSVKMKLEDIFPKLYSPVLKQMSLTLMHDGMTMEKSYTVSIKPMEMYSFLLEH